MKSGLFDSLVDLALLHQHGGMSSQDRGENIAMCYGAWVYPPFRWDGDLSKSSSCFYILPLRSRLILGARQLAIKKYQRH